MNFGELHDKKGLWFAGAGMMSYVTSSLAQRSEVRQTSRHTFVDN
jgi:hypothetical protein